MNAHLKRKIRKIISPIKRVGLNNKNFSIISNNCFGGYIYDIYGLQYLTPTIGLYFFSKEYIKFLNNLPYYLSLECEPLEVKDSKYKEILEKRTSNPMLGKVGDVEIVFVHYDSAEEGCRKWNKRRGRVNFDNLIVKYNDQNLFEIEDFEEFKKMYFSNKLFFTANKSLCDNNFSYFLKKYDKIGYVLDDIKSSKSLKYKKFLNQINKGGN